MENLITLGGAILFLTILLVGSYVAYILCLLFIKLTDVIQKFTEWLENKSFNKF